MNAVDRQDLKQSGGSWQISTGSVFQSLTALGKKVRVKIRVRTGIPAPEYGYG